jgi:hypothetical protein
MGTMRRARAVYVAALLVGLAALQVRAQVEQFRSGYRPFAHAPTRVPYSWDMFAIRLDRCVVGWDPPLQIEGQRVARWHDRLPDVEFDSIFNEASWYAAAAGRGCEYRTTPRTTAILKCFGSNGESHEFGFDCP